MHFLIRRCPDIAKLLLKRGFDAISIDDSQISILNTTYTLGLAALAKAIFRLFPSLAFISAKDGTTPLHQLFIFEIDNIVEIGELLVVYGAQLYATAIRDFPEFNFILSGPPLHQAIIVRNEPAVRTLLDLSANMLNITSYYPYHALYSWHALCLATCLFMPEIVRILLDAGVSVNLIKVGIPVDKKLGGPLYQLGNITDPFRLQFYHRTNVDRTAKEIVGALLNAGANINACIPRTALETQTLQYSYLTQATKALLAYEPSIEVSKDYSFRENSLIYLATLSLQHNQLNGEKMKVLLEYIFPKLSQNRFVS